MTYRLAVCSAALTCLSLLLGGCGAGPCGPGSSKCSLAAQGLVTVQAPLETLDGATVTLCRNEACSEGQVTLERGPDGAVTEGHVTLQPVPGQATDARKSGGVLRPGAETSVLALYYDVTADRVDDGDRYTVRVTSAGGEELFGLSREVKYQEERMDMDEENCFCLTTRFAP